ncbi:MAG: hypothetical protein EOO45_19940 [Flavobacterium sp.]|nr:MAG: hypothetical protein EOO45_19940 [Flavobacterium sp.]
MPYTQEITGAVALLSISIYYLYRRSKTKEERQHLLIKFKRTQNESLRLEDDLKKYLSQNEAHHERAKTILSELQRCHTSYLSEELYIKVRDENNILLRTKTNRSLDIQKKRLKEIKKEMIELKIKALL